MNQRTLTQNKALYKYFELLSESLNNAGYDMKKVLKPQIDISWTSQSVKNYLWKPIQDVMYKTNSTTKLDTKQVNEVYEVLNRHLSEKLGISVSFPSLEIDMIEQLSKEYEKK